MQCIDPVSARECRVLLGCLNASSALADEHWHVAVREYKDQTVTELGGRVSDIPGVRGIAE